MTGLFPDAPQAFTIDDQIAAAEREVALRKRVYPDRVRDKKMSADFAEFQVGAMEAIVVTLKRCKERGEVAAKIAGGWRP